MFLQFMEAISVSHILRRAAVFTLSASQATDIRLCISFSLSFFSAAFLPAFLAFSSSPRREVKSLV
jgi:hypothetical protein